LDLIRQVRMEQHQNRNTLSNREYLLYGKPRPLTVKSELYGLEATATAGTLPDRNQTIDGKVLKSFKIRLLIAVALFAVYVFIDQVNINIFGINAIKIHELINNGFEGLTGYFVDLLN